MLLFPEFLPADWIGSIGMCRLCHGVRSKSKARAKIGSDLCDKCWHVFDRWFSAHYCAEIGRKQAGIQPDHHAPHPDPAKEARYQELSAKDPTTTAESREWGAISEERPWDVWRERAYQIAQEMQERGPTSEDYVMWVSRQLDRVAAHHKRTYNIWPSSRDHMPEDVR